MIRKPTQTTVTLVVEHSPTIHPSAMSDCVAYLMRAYADKIISCKAKRTK